MPEPPNKDQWEQQRESFADKLVDLLEDPKCEVFFGDEAGFEGDPRPRLKWVKRGSRPTQGYYGGHVRQNVVGAVSPTTGQLVSLIVPHCDTEVFQLFLDVMASEVPKKRNKKVILVLDNASWHKAKSLNWHHIEAAYLIAAILTPLIFASCEQKSVTVNPTGENTKTTSSRKPQRPRRRRPRPRQPSVPMAVSSTRKRPSR